MDCKQYSIKNRILRDTILKNYDDPKIYLYKYMQSNYHINGYEMRNYIDNRYPIRYKVR